MRSVFIPLAGVLVILALGGPAAAQADSTELPPIGRMVAVDDRQVHIYCTGAARAGAPTVVREDGLGGIGSLTWTWVQGAVSKVARVCSYDRPGYGWSDPADLPMDAAHVSRQLRAILAAAHERPPYVVVGHSIGGVYARMFATEHRDEVTGLVLVDATHPDILTTHDGLPPIDEVRGGAVAGFLSASGMLPLAIKIGLVKADYDPRWNDLPPKAASAFKSLTLSPRSLETFLKEKSTLSDSLNQVATLDGLGSMPVAVIASDTVIGKDAETAERIITWHTAQERNWLGISTKSRWLVVRGADHNSLLNTKEHAGEVAEAIVKMVAPRRRG